VASRCRRRSPPGVPDLDLAALVLDPPERRRLPTLGCGEVGVGGQERAGVEDVLDVHEEELLVLLLVVAAELGQRGDALVEVTVEQVAMAPSTWRR